MQQEKNEKTKYTKYGETVVLGNIDKTQEVLQQAKLRIPKKVKLNLPIQDT